MNKTSDLFESKKRKNRLWFWYCLRFQSKKFTLYGNNNFTFEQYCRAKKHLIKE